MVIKKARFKDLSDNITSTYYNSQLESVNNHTLRISVMKTDYPWHYHPNSDELFIILEGELILEIKDQSTLYLQPGDYVKVPAGVIHKTSAVHRTVNLCLELQNLETIYLNHDR